MRKLYCAVLALTVCFLTGCGESVDPGKGVPVNGRVTMGGKPLEGAIVTFMNNTFAGVGRTDAEGKYRLVQGAAPGMNKITISKIEGGPAAASSAIPGGINADPAYGLDAGQAEAATMGAAGGNKAPTGPKDLVPADFSSPVGTKLTYEVPTGGATDVNFDI